jgi:hypothetical protein
MAAQATAARCATPKAPRGLLHHHPGHGRHEDLLLLRFWLRALDRGADLRLARALPPARQGLREPCRERSCFPLPRHDVRLVGRSAPALPRARLRAMMGASIVGLIGRERCAGNLPLSTISTGARAQGRDALCSGGCATFGDRANLRCRKRRSCHFPPRRRHAPTEKPTTGFPEQPDPGRTRHGRTSEGLVTPPHGSSRSSASRRASSRRDRRWAAAEGAEGGGDASFAGSRME